MRLRRHPGEGSEEPLAQCSRCGTRLTVAGGRCPGCDGGGPIYLRPGDVVGGCFRVEEELGRGGMGVVYRAHDEWLERPVALKLVAAMGDPLAEEKLQSEARALATLRSQHVVQIYTFGRHQGSHFFAMEYVHGRSLEAVIAEHRAEGARLPVHRAVTVLARIAEGLSAVHRAGLIHRDVKPANIIIEADTGRPVLVDFGLAAPRRAPTDERFEGTPHYMAPEQFQGLDVPLGPQSDLYALACVAFEMLTGRVPFDQKNIFELLNAHCSAERPRASLLRPELAPADEVLMRAMARDPSQRHESCGAFVRELAAALATSEITTLPPASLRAASSPDIDRALRILTVDDDPAFGKLASKAVELGARGIPLRLFVARSGHEALALAQVTPPDLVLLDLDMPGLDGLETLSHLRSLPSGERARVVVLSGRVGPQERWRFSVLGVRDFVPKPVDFRHLVETIRQIVVRAGWVSQAPA